MGPRAAEGQARPRLLLGQPPMGLHVPEPSPTPTTAPVMARLRITYRSLMKIGLTLPNRGLLFGAVTVEQMLRRDASRHQARRQSRLGTVPRAAALPRGR